MKIKWNEYTWYSKLLAAIFFIVILPAWTFYIGTQYQSTVESQIYNPINMNNVQKVKIEDYETMVAQFNKITKGQSMQEVRDLVGEPVSIGKTDVDEYFAWDYDLEKLKNFPGRKYGTTFHIGGSVIFDHTLRVKEARLSIGAPPVPF